LADSNSTVSEVNSSGCSLTFDCLVVEQYVGGVFITQDMYDLWDSLGKPECWCYDCHWRGDSNGDCLVFSMDVTIAFTGWLDYQKAELNHYGYCADTNNDGIVFNEDVTADL